LNGIIYLYEMLTYLGYLIFILSVAFAAGGVVLTTRLRNRYHLEIFSTLLYFQVFIFTFGFYGIWGQVVIKAFLANYISPELLQRFSDIALLLGLPFLVFAWLMLIQFSMGLTGRKNSNWIVLWFLLLNFLVIFSVGYYIAKTNSIQPLTLLKYYFITMHFLYSLVSSLLIFFHEKGKPIIHDYDSRRIGIGIFIFAVLQCVPLVFYSSQPYVAAIFTFIFFAGNTFLPIYLNYGTLFTVFSSVNDKNIPFEEFCRKFEVSPRETDIVREICNGLSNKEISDKLFISLQTVKDHTHRIYTKTNVKSRVQLIYLVKELKIL
jgi:DNA-binding CsgD family transcriptional regulator